MCVDPACKNHSFTAVQAHVPLTERDWERDDWEHAPREMLEQEICTFAGHLAAATAQWLTWVGIYDRHQYATKQGFRSTADWLNMFCGISPVTARTHVRVARALEEFPQVQALFLQGQLSYSKVRSITRVANQDNLPDLLAMAPHCSASQLDKACNGYHRSKPKPPNPDNPRLVRSRNNNNGTTTILITLPNDNAQDALTCIHKRTDQLIANATPPDSTRRATINDHGGLGAYRAEAAYDLLTQPAGGPPTEHKPCEHPVTNPTAATLNVPAEALAQEETDQGRCATSNQKPISNGAARRLLCDPKINALVEDAQGNPVGVSSTGRLISHKLRLALEHRDQHMCQFPGCSATHRLHAHHIKHWADLGPTELDNLILVCHYHHHVIHDLVIAGKKWQIDPTTRQFIHPNGQIAIPKRSRGIAHKTLRPPHPSQPTINHRTLLGYEPDPMDLPFITSTMHHNEQTRRKRREGRGDWRTI